MMGVLLQMTQTQQRQIDELLKSLAARIGALDVATEVAKAAASDITASAKSAKASVAEMAPQLGVAVSMAVEPALLRCFQWAGNASAKALDDAAKPVLGQLKESTQVASATADQLDQKLRRAALWVNWRLWALPFAVALLILSFAWYRVCEVSRRSCGSQAGVRLGH